MQPSQAERHVITRRLAPDEIGAAAEVLAQGGLLGFPTETVYGLGADARDDRAVAGIFAAKGRPAFNPLIVHVASLQAAQALAEFPPETDEIARAFWPGPLTLVLPLRAGAGLSPLVTAGLSTVGLRVPAHPLAQALLVRFGGPVAAPSANPSGRISPTEADHVLAGLSGRIAAVLDGGACGVGLESTIVGFGPAGAMILRQGGVAAEALARWLDPEAKAADPERPIAPGQLASHYAPKGALRLNATAAEGDEVLIGFGPVPGSGGLTLSSSGDLTEAAGQLFRLLHRMDAEGVARIAVAPIPETGLGRAINDRLRRAAAPRPLQA